MEKAYLKSIRCSGGIIITWIKRVCEGELMEMGLQSITVKLSAGAQKCKWHLTGVYGANDRRERKEIWWELVAIRSICSR